ncbi:MerR family transcriptional regulator [Aureibacillus halotolerans]|uniref:MerR family transcriptional regulator n=1 Tax=Aureibacillus halotolerans TaxID=1508390 RepID=A0A4V3D5R2_9BACI|nr:MerR family transcriptional regulator [Aureibacillus halotolerans]TDQ41067.1 MerR family transcriptional regulator [Aureibacillus halotolerans]
MEYTVKKLAQMAGVSARTLRYYDEIGMLKPARINSSGYRIYGAEEVDRLQQILFYKELGVELEQIKSIVTDPTFNGLAALKEHQRNLLQKRALLDALLGNVKKTIEQTERGIPMRDQEKFEAFKQKAIQENEAKYGEEIREKYGGDRIDASNKKFMNMTVEEYEAFKALEQEVLDTLIEAYKTGDPAGPLGQKTADLHKQWLTYTWSSYSPEAHVGLAQMYVDDERFTKYYDDHQPGGAEFLRDAVLAYTGKPKS